MNSRARERNAGEWDRWTRGSAIGARLQGAGLVIAVESVPARQELARRYGEDEILEFTKAMTTHTFPFKEIETAFHMMDAKEDGIIKPLIDFVR